MTPSTSAEINKKPLGTVLDRKITAALAPKKEEQDGKENKQVNPVEAPATDNKKSMVAEPTDHYQQRESLGSRIIIGGCGATPPGGFRAAGPKL